MNKVAKKSQGFTLLEVLLALSIIAIALTALIRSTAQNVAWTQRIKEKSIHHWVAMQAVQGIQLGMVPIHPHQTVSNVTTLFGQKVYWRATLSSTPVKSMQRISILISGQETGPFGNELIAFRTTL